jgi:hypothetical protein
MNMDTMLSASKMKRLIIFIVSVFFTVSIVNAQVRYLPEDTVIFNRFLQYSEQGDNSIISVARFFHGTPYTGGTLEGDDIEQLRVNLRELDCVTFVENVIALQLMMQSGQHTFSEFCRILQKIRYRNGIIDGYLSRLHYFSDWLDNNRIMGIIDLPAIKYCSSITPAVSYMSTHCVAYPALKTNPDWCKKMSAIEKSINELTFCYIPKEKVKDAAANIKTGDIIAITTHKAGMDIAHTGFALIQNGKVYLLHASLDAKKVLISNETLHEYLARIKNHSGVIVARIRP